MFVKVCCITDEDEARLAVAAGASALGLVSAMPSGPGPISEEEIARIAAAVPRPTETFLLTALVEAEAIAEQQRRCGTTAVQLVDAVAEPELRRLRQLLPGVRLVQVIHVTGPDSLETSRRDQAARACRWLTQVGVTITPGSYNEGRGSSQAQSVAVPAVIEISPLFALDAEELTSRVAQIPAIRTGSPTYLE